MLLLTFVATEPCAKFPELAAVEQLKLTMVAGHWPPLVQVTTPLQLVKTCPFVPPAGTPLPEVIAVLAEEAYKA